MRGIVTFLAVLVGLLGVVTIVGVMLPSGHVVSARARFQQPQDAVWLAVSDIAASPSWRKDLAEVRQLPDQNGHPVWRETYRDGSVLTLETVESVPSRRLARRVIDSALPFSGTWEIQIEPANGASQVTITEHGEIRNPIVRFASRLISGQRATIENYLRQLGRKFGEEVRFIE